MQFTIIGNPENRRVTSFCEAAQKLECGIPAVIPYREWLSGHASLLLSPGNIVKIDSPGENSIVRKMLIARGQGVTTSALHDGHKNIPDEFGIIGDMRAWYAGFCNCLDELSYATREQAAVWCMNDPADIQLQFNKPECQAWLQQNDIPVPLRLPPVTGYDDLVAQMQQYGLTKVFIKPAHGSSGSGVIAFRKMGHRAQAVTSAEMVADATGIKLYNSLKICTYTSEVEISALINRMVQENIFAEEWLPKAALNNRFFDIRVLVIDGKARHTVVRTSCHFITNLHLGNRRGDLQELTARIGIEKLEAVRQLAERTAACFPASLYIGVDILLTADLRKTYVLEVNAFGDLLPGLVDEGETCYEAEIKAAIRQRERTVLC